MAKLSKKSGELMIPFQEKLQNAPKPEWPLPTFLQATLLLILTIWLAATPLTVGAITAFLPGSWSPTLSQLAATGLLVSLLGLPLAAFAGWVYWQKRQPLYPFTLALLSIALYITLDSLIRTFTTPPLEIVLSLEPHQIPTEVIVRLLLLTPFTLILGGVTLWLAGVPRWMIPHAFGFDRPTTAALLAGVALVAIITIGWPLTGALGDSWGSFLVLWQALATTLPEVVLFWGAILGIITFNFQQRKIMAAGLTLLLYLAFIPSMIIPRGEWGSLLLLLSAIPLALLMIELRALTGSIWTGILVAWLYRATPLLFTDPRVDVPLLTQPWQAAAYLWLILGMGLLAILLWLGRLLLAPRWPFAHLGTMLTALLIAGLAWGVWVGLWLGFGQPGLHNDGFLIIMTEQADLSTARNIDAPLERRAFVRAQLLETASRTQAPVRAALETAGLAYRPFYLINMIRVEGHHRRMAEFAELPGVERVLLNPNVRPYPLPDLEMIGSPLLDAEEAPPPDSTTTGLEWNIDDIEADEVWQLGISGAGIIIGGQDTGYDWQHPALQRSYRGGPSPASHDYTWHDAWAETTAPFDDGQHGTHTMGTMVGDDGQGHQIGVAPAAQWIGCRNMQRGIGNPASYTDCMEFFLAPYPLGGDPFTEGDVTMAPHVINNSWACPDIEGCDDTVLEPALEALRAAGIMMVVSAGNSGPGCQTVSEPPASYDAAFSVGATERGGGITGFSSRGPVADTALLKPDIAAPGTDIRSSIPGGGYGPADGTSMAGPHVAGLVALLWSANPALIGNIEATEEIIRQSAQPTALESTCAIESSPTEMSLLEQAEALNNPPTCACGELIGSPNNVYGAGEIDALAAVQLALAYEE